MATHDELRLLSIFHYVLAGLTGLFGLFPLAYLGLGVAFLSGALDDGKATPPPAFLGWIFVGIGVVLLLLVLGYIALLVLAGRSLAARRRWTLCAVVAGISCVHMPLGTVLGVFTLVVLMRPETKALFQPPAGP